MARDRPDSKKLGEETAELAELLKSGSREEVARRLAPIAGGVLARRLGSREAALAELPAALKAVGVLRRRFNGGSVQAWVLRTLSAKGLGPSVDTPAEAAPLPADGEPEELARAPGLDAAVRGLLGRVGEGREALELLAVEELTASEAKEIIGEPAAVVERRASLAFVELVERLVSG